MPTIHLAGKRIVVPRYMMPHYIAGNRYEGCGHQHKTSDTARKCRDRANKASGRKNTYSIYYMWYEGKKPRHERIV